MKVYSPAVMGDCSINPNSGLGYYPDRLPQPEGRRRVLVVGGGVGGMQAAITAARRGHDVTLAEASDRLGGVLLFAEHDHDKREWIDFVEVLRRELAETDATVELNTVVDEAYLERMRPEHVIIAVGAHNRGCSLPGRRARDGRVGLLLPHGRARPLHRDRRRRPHRLRDRAQPLGRRARGHDGRAQAAHHAHDLRLLPQRPSR